MVQLVDVLKVVSKWSCEFCQCKGYDHDESCPFYEAELGWLLDMLEELYDERTETQ